MKILSFVLAILALVCAVTCTEGFDLSYFQGDVSSSSFTCLKNAGYEFAIFQAGRSNSAYNPYAGDDYSRAKAAGIANIDFYLFPCTEQGIDKIKTIISSLKSAGCHAKNMIWLDIEAADGCWSSSTSTNVSFVQEVIDYINGEWTGCGLSTGCTGIYASKSEYTPILGSSTAFSNLQLWYPHYSSSDSFESFGGWTSYNIRQYAGTTSACSTSIDLDKY
ncbi:Glycoside hydrolase, family 25 like protein [Aduncisulcus paluster]|uniref:Glycoside hydrolase, family 25 like protein n=1 Tax=Aduncisulcus paluster TaxID=2918883 RepID=A0ABQ5JSZ2_9EUKA|nr:Glycoside hydrolase, family 25 like protein [Aduncisulcus paluster]